MGCLANKVLHDVPEDGMMDHINIVYPDDFRSPNNRKLERGLNGIGNLGSRVP